MIALRRLMNCEEDYQLLAKWYQQEFVYKYFEQRVLTYEEVKKKYYPRTLENSEVVVYMIEVNRKPVGIVQYKLIDNVDRKLYKLSSDNSYEIDIFIGEEEFHGQGIGVIVINKICDKLINYMQAELFVMCPLKDNKRAIKCYLKCGFDIRREIELTDTLGRVQEYTLMIRKNV